MTGRQTGITLLSASLCVAAAACQETSPLPGPGSLRQDFSVSRAPFSITPGPGRPPPLPPAPPTLARLPPEGRYTGLAVVVDNPRNLLCNQSPVTEFFVRGDVATLRGFRGRIAPDGTVTMQAGTRFIYGRFAGPEFLGRNINPPPSCTYELRLRLSA